MLRLPTRMSLLGATIVSCAVARPRPQPVSPAPLLGPRTAPPPVANEDIQDRDWAHWLPASKDGKVGFVDRSGHWRIEPRFEFAWPFPEGEDRARVWTCDGVGYIDPAGAIAIAPSRREEELFNLTDFHDGLLVVGDSNGSSVVDRDGRVLFVTSRWLGPFVGGVFVSRPMEPCRVEIFDRSGRIIGAQDGYASYFDFGSDALLPTCACRPGRSPARCGYLDRTGNWAIPPRYANANPFKNGAALVATRDGMNAIDPAGHLLVRGRFERVTAFSEGLACVTVRGRAGFVDEQGGMVVPLREGECVEPSRGFSEGLSAFLDADSRRVGFVDRTGAWKIAPTFATAGTFHDGLAPATTTRGAFGIPDWHCGYIDHAGRWVVPPRFNICPDVQEGIAAPETNDQLVLDGPPRPTDYFDTAGHFIAHLEFPEHECGADGGASVDAGK